MSDLQVSIRPATDDDLSQLLDIENRVHVAPWGKDGLAAELHKPQSQVFVLTDDETDEKIMAYIVFWIMGDEGHILNVAVDLPYRGLGYAKKLVQQAVKEAIKSQVKKLTLEVRKSNQSALELYQGARFSITHVRKSFYSNGEDAYFMELPLDGGDAIEQYWSNT